MRTTPPVRTPEPPRFTLEEWSRRVKGEIRDHSYLATGLGAAVHDYLALTADTYSQFSFEDQELAVELLPEIEA